MSRACGPESCEGSGRVGVVVERSKEQYMVQGGDWRLFQKDMVSGQWGGESNMDDVWGERDDCGWGVRRARKWRWE